MAFDSARHVVVLFGGFSSVAATACADTSEWNGSAWTQATPAASPSARSAAAMSARRLAPPALSSDP
jgi:hypothetical protein